MPLIRNGQLVENTWIHVETSDFVATPNGITVPLDIFLDHREALARRNTPVGVRLMPDDDPAALADALDMLALIEISFPRYTDGRGYSQAQLLRRRYGYTGELRAVGHVLRDQVFYMHRSGFDAFETARAGVEDVDAALAEYSAVYQRAADGARPVFAARHATGA